jgi:hypothetical protein
MLLFLSSLTTISIAIILNMSSIPDRVQIILYGILRLITGVVANVYVIGTVHVIELVGVKWRVTANNSFYYSFILGEFITLAFGFIFKDYRSFHIALAVYVTSFLFYYWIVPESPRYLLVKRQKFQAFCVLKRIAKSNERAIRGDILEFKMGQNCAPNVLNRQLERQRSIEIPTKVSRSKHILLSTIFLSI